MRYSLPPKDPHLTMPVSHFDELSNDPLLAGRSWNGPAAMYFVNCALVPPTRSGYPFCASVCNQTVMLLAEVLPGAAVAADTVTASAAMRPTAARRRTLMRLSQGIWTTRIRRTPTRGRLARAEP